MQPLGGTRKRKSDQLEITGDNQFAVDMASQKVPTKEGSSHPNESPAKRQRVGITLAQKQALIDNLHLEITERARKLRANYNIHAQSLRTRIEIRVNRIPLSLRKLTMGELLERYSKEPQQRHAANTGSVRGPPVPAKDVPSRPPTRGAMTAHPVKRRSHEISGGDKENQVQTPQKKMRAHTGAEVARNPTHVLSPTTSNSRVAPRTVATPARSGIARPAPTPGRAVAATNILNKMVEGARSTTRPPTTAASSSPRKTLTGTGTTSSSASASTAAAAAAAARRKRGATVSTAGNPPSSASRPATRTARRASGASETSEDSTSTTIIRKRPMTAPPGAQPKPPPSSQQQSQQAASGRRTVMGSIKKSVNGGGAARKVPAGKATAAAGSGGTSSASGARVLRKRA
ncbi:Borealin N terminal-domain-containing protein [Chaetomium tenue]|uniref:Borealin N terminal-domain-containing protein n=1 Tax=Chaetomium tenue TaxID=1854479 RepID=A0ACB7P475_9PEZI|nr:Borealin N terminal-domain-containing protein [Chaetomium globosum]